MASPILPPVIIRGTEGDDQLIGEIPNTNELIFGFGGNDEIDGSGGNDEIDGGLGDDIINTADGADKIFGGGGNDEILTGEGNDFIFGDDGPETLPLEEGGAADDYIDGEGGDDIILGEVGADTLIGGFGSDFLSGGDGDDLIYSHTGRINTGIVEKDEMFGGLGADTFNLLADYTGGRASSIPARERSFRDGSFAVIRDFNINEDELNLLRPANNYSFKSGNFGGRAAADTFITRNGNTVAVVLDTRARSNTAGTVTGLEDVVGIAAAAPNPPSSII